MTPILDWIIGVLRDLASWSKEQWSRVLVAAIIVFAVWRIIVVENENKALISDKRTFEQECNQQLNAMKDTYYSKINDIKDSFRMEKIYFLQEQLEEYKRIEAESRKAVQQTKLLKSKIK